MFKLGQSVPQTSLKSFLAETAISVVLALVLATTNIHAREIVKASQSEGSALFLGFLVLLLLYPFGLAVNGFSYFLLGSWVMRIERWIYIDPRSMQHTKSIFGLHELKQIFGLKKYRDYRQRVEIFEELEFVLRRFAAGQGHTIGLEQFFRNLAAILPLVSCFYASQFSQYLGIDTGLAALTLFAGSAALVPALLLFSAQVRLYRGLFYLAVLRELNLYVSLRSMPAVKTSQEGKMATYRAINRLLRSNLNEAPTQ